MSVEIAQWRKEQMGELSEFLRNACPANFRKHDVRYLNGYFVQNPNVKAEEIPLWVVMDDGKIVGQLATIPVQLKANASYTKVRLTVTTADQTRFALQRA
jgi:hypothetical protein